MDPAVSAQLESLKLKWSARAALATVQAGRVPSESVLEAAEVRKLCNEGASRLFARCGWREAGLGRPRTVRKQHCAA